VATASLGYQAAPVIPVVSSSGQARFASAAPMACTSTSAACAMEIDRLTSSQRASVLAMRIDPVRR
jgi:hypothetical protein